MDLAGRDSEHDADASHLAGRPRRHEVLRLGKGRRAGAADDDERAVLGIHRAVLHWLYFTPVRRNNVVWADFVIWVSLIGTAMCGLGIAIGIWRYSLAGRFRLRREASHTPYAGWIKWHHYTGLIFGFFACTWAFSGALSLSPFAFLQTSPPTRAFREAATGGPIDLTSLTVERIRSVVKTVGQSFRPREIDFFQFLGEPYFIAYAPAAPSEHESWRNADIAAATALNIDRQYVLVSARHPERGAFTSFERDRMWDVAKAAMPGAPIAESTWLDAYDSYYYSHAGAKPLPVLRIRYSDPRRTWLYLDPQQASSHLDWSTPADGTVGYTTASTASTSLSCTTSVLCGTSS
jgi:hypothetical protein